MTSNFIFCLPNSQLQWHVDKQVKWNPTKIAPFLRFMVADLVSLLELGLVAYFVTLPKYEFMASRITFLDRVFFMMSYMLFTMGFSCPSN